MPRYGLFRPGIDTPLQLFGHRSTSVGARATLPLAFILHFFTALLLVLAFIAWITGCETQAQNSNNPADQRHIVHNYNASRAFQNGLWACDLGFQASDLDSKIYDIQRKGVEVTHEIINQMANINKCRRIDSDNLKPINFFIYSGPKPAIVFISDGKQDGWTGMASYVAYMQFHVVRKPEAK